MTPQTSTSAARQTCAQSSTASILFVDSLPETRGNITRFLQQNDYSVQTCGSGEEALELLNSSNRNYRLLVLDLSQLAGSVQKLLNRIHKIAPDLRLIVAPGKRSPVPAEELYRLGVVALLPKPYDYDMLRRLVKAVLAE